MHRQPTRNCRAMIEGFEARRKKGYLDVAGVPTAGVGHIGPGVIVGKVYSDAQIEQWFDADIAEAVATIYRRVPAAIIEELPDESYDALVSFIFNVGDQAFRNPKTGKETNFAKALRGRRFTEVDDRMQDWVYAGGKKVNGLITRRADEAARWNRGFAARAAVGPMPEPEPLPAVAPAQPAEETNVVPDAPVKEPIMPVKMLVSTLTTVGGAATAIAPEHVVSAGSQLRSMLPDIKVFSIIGGILVAIGVGLTLWGQYKRAKKSGA